MDKKLTVIEAAKLLGVSKEAIYNRLRRGTLQSVIENGTKYIIVSKNTMQIPPVRKVESSFDSAYIELLKLQLEEVKLKNAQLEADKERLISDKEKLLIESKEKIEAIYKEKDEQLKTILSLANRQITVNNPDIATPVRQTPKETFFEESYEFVDELLFEEADVLEEEAKNEVVETMFGSYSDWRDLRSYLKEKGFSKKEKQNISHKLGKKVGQDGDVMDKNGKIFIKKGKKLKEILGS